MIHPRRLKGSASTLARYYAVGDYYKKGDAEPSEWGGALASELGLEGKVDHKQLKALLEGNVGDRQLGRNRANGQIEHHPGWDFAVSAPKSVSIMALVAGDARIVAAHERAVGEALAYLEEHAALRHRQEGEIVHETTGRLLYARFTEHASRELDPHLHTHVVVLNMTNRGDGSGMVSLETRAMFTEQMTAGQIYRNALAQDLRTLGYEIEFDAKRGLFEIADVPKTLIAAMSRRAEQIEEHAKEHGLTGQKARVRAWSETRSPKQKQSLEALHHQWTTRSAPHARTLDDLRDKAGADAREMTVDPATANRAALFGLRQSETGEAVNNLSKLIRTGLAAHVGQVRLADVRPILDAHQERRKLLAVKGQTGDDVLVRGRTSLRTVRLEIGLSEHLSLSLGDSVPLGSREQVEGALADGSLNQAQAKAVRDIALSDDRLKGVHGVAGAGKSTLVKGLIEASDPDWTYIAIAPTSSAAANLGRVAGIEVRTVAKLLGGGGRDLDDRHVMVVDEAGQLSNRQAVRILDISRESGARVILLGDNKQTGAIEQGKAFWLLQQLGLPTSQLAESLRQETARMKAAVAAARAGKYEASLAALDKVASGESADKLAADMVREWTRLKPENRAETNILVLDNATRILVNANIREALKKEGVVAAEETQLQVLTPAGLSAEEKRFARFYTNGLVVTFARDNAEAGVAQGAEYRVTGLAHTHKGRMLVRLTDENGRSITWDPRLGRASQVNVFVADKRALAVGDRIQWRLANSELALKNAERGTVERLDGSFATIRWDRDGEPQTIDLGRHKTWDHGYAETVYSAQSKTYARAYVLAPVNSPLVTGQNYYTAITRARFGAKLWTEDPSRLAEKLERRSGEKTSALEALGRLTRDAHKDRGRRHAPRIEAARIAKANERRDRKLARKVENARPEAFAEILAGKAHQAADSLDRYLRSLLKPTPPEPEPGGSAHLPTPNFPQPTQGPER